MATIHFHPNEGAEDISAADLERIRVWNETVPPAVKACVHHLIEEKVREQPDDEAICSRDGSLSYRELDGYANMLASRLVLHGIKPDDLVPMCFEKSMWTVVAMIAVLKAGAAFVPIPCSPVQRIKTILSLIRPTVILTSVRQATIFEDMNEYVIIVGKDSCDEMEGVRLEPLEMGIRPSNLAYVLFTSGSTGTPKGAQIEHSQLCTHLKTWGDTVGFDRTSRVFQFGAHVFDAVIDEVFLPLIYGGTVCIPSDDDRMNNIAGAMRDMRVTYTLFTPSLLSTLRPEDFDLTTLKTLVIAGELPPQDLLTLWSSIPELEVFNAYGPTECCVICCAANITRMGPRARNIGRAVGDTLWILDASNINKLAQIGAMGELLIEGSTVGRGYIGADEKSAAAFVQTPLWLRSFRNGGNHRLYRTGDLVKYNTDGTIEFVERKDNQVKLRGQRMELGEVESQLRHLLPSRTSVIVEIISTESSGGEPTLAAFIHLAGEKDINSPESSSGRLVIDTTVKQEFDNLIASVKPQLSEVLPSYMIPSAFVAMDSMPHLDSSKVDRAKLRDIFIDSLPPLTNGITADGAREPQRPPVTDTEKQLQHIWAEAFRMATSRIGLDDGFFRLGGDSVTAIRLVAIARRAGLSMTVHMLFDHPTIAELAATIQPSIGIIHEKGMPEPYALLANDPSPIQDLRLAAVQQCSINLNMIEDIYPLPELYQPYMAVGELRAAIKFPLPTGIDIERYLECWRRLVKSHEMLRTRIIKTATGMYSVVTTEPPHIRKATDIDAFTSEEKKATIGFGDALSAYCFIKDPNDGRKTCFLWIAHHAIYDAWSLGLINAKLRRAYADSNFVLAENPKPKQLFQHILSLDRTVIHNYWRVHYAGVTFKPLFPLPAGRYWEGDQEIALQINLSQPSTAETPQFTIPAIITVAWALALSRHFQVADIALGILRSGRTLPVEGVENFIGPVITVPPWHVHVDEAAPVHEFIRNFQRNLWESTGYESIGFIEVMGLSPEAAAASADQLWVNIHVKDMEAEERERAEKNELPAPVEDMFYPMAQPLRLECEVDGKGVSAVAHYDRSVAREVVQEVVDAFEKAFMGLNNASEGQRFCDIASE